jgi:hypothetical protein
MGGRRQNMGKGCNGGLGLNGWPADIRDVHFFTPAVEITANPKPASTGLIKRPIPPSAAANFALLDAILIARHC